MKAAFNIPPGNHNNSDLHLLIEIGSYGISYTWFTKMPFSVSGLAIHNFSGGEIIPAINNSLEIHKGFLNALSSVTICFNFTESVLIPEKFNDLLFNKQSLSLIYGEIGDDILFQDIISSAGIINQYRVPEMVSRIFTERFPSAEIFHSTSLQVEQLINSFNLMYCIIFHNTLKLLLFKEGKLQIVQQLNYTSPEDVAYHLLNCCEQHAVNPAEIELRLSGMIDKNSKLFSELYNYFLDIDFDNNVVANLQAEGQEALPAHFFSHLTALATCVS